MTPAMESLQRFLARHAADRHPPREPEVKEFLRGLGVPVPAGVFITAGRPIPAPLPLTYPLVAKVVAPGIAGKTEVGGVRLGLRDAAALAAAVTGLEAIPGAAGVQVEEEARPGVEVIVGGVIDPQFGPVVMFGLGGVAVELFRDVAFALAPLEREAARRLAAAPKGAALLHGWRGRPAVDREALVSVIVTVSELIGSGLLEEIDLNPVLLYPDGAMVVDAKLKQRGE